ncbi:MAG: cupin domain-containing protein [Alphaproteobacteria bacterium]|nr:cupin domain-containing protein [Alphaproteobacteria bacterium]
MSRPKSTTRRIEETPPVIISESGFAPGTETGWHRHNHDSIVVCLSAGQLTAETSQGTVVNDLAMGQTYTRPEGVEHNIVNTGPGEFVFIEIELK